MSHNEKACGCVHVNKIDGEPVKRCRHGVKVWFGHECGECEEEAQP